MRHHHHSSDDDCGSNDDCGSEARSHHNYHCQDHGPAN